MTYLREPAILTAVGYRLKEIRLKKGFTQEDVAKKAGIAISQIGRIERGQLNPSVSTLFVISNALGIQPKELFDFEAGIIQNKIANRTNKKNSIKTDKKKKR